MTNDPNYPTKLCDLIFLQQHPFTTTTTTTTTSSSASSSFHPSTSSTSTSTSTRSNIYHLLKTLRKSTLSLHNRLLSIIHDSEYITSTVHEILFPDFPIIANERCGSWYVHPDLKSGSAYFKSTDGHYGVWDFSLRRLNLAVLEALGRCRGSERGNGNGNGNGNGGGVVLVDSTRRGKRMPDALRRTVPIWVMVWNRVLFGDDEENQKEGLEWAFRLQHPGLEPAEVRLIEAKVGEWVEGLKGLGLDLVALKEKVKCPIRLAWLVHGEEVQDFLEDEDDDHNDDEGEEDNTEEVSANDNNRVEQDSKYNLLVLCSASRPVLGAEMSEDGYVQGAADDAEEWSGGLTSTLFWKYQTTVLGTPEEQLPDLIKRLAQESKESRGDIVAVKIEPTTNIYVSSSPSALSAAVLPLDFTMIVDCNGPTDANGLRLTGLGCRPGKLGSKDLRLKLSLAVDCISSVLKNNADANILIMCENGRDLSIGVTVAVLCLLFDDQGRYVSNQESAVDKQLVKKRLAWITTVKPDANPSRSTLQAVNSYLM